MKKITSILALILLGVISYAQNEMFYKSQIFEDSVVYVEKKVDLSFLRENNLVTKRLADSIALYLDKFMIRDVNTDYRMLLREFALNTNWGIEMVTDLAIGDYSNYYNSYQDTIMTNFFDLIFSNDQKAKKELTSRIRNELITDKTTLIDSICTGYTIVTNRRVVGKLIGYNYADRTAVLLQKDGVFCWYIDYFTFAIAGEKEKEAYIKGEYYLDK